MKQAERLTLAVLSCGIISLALSDFVSPFYWLLATSVLLLRWWRGSSLAVSEMQASMIGWVGFVWGGIELMLGRPWIVVFTDFLLILSLAVIIEAPTPRNHLHRMLVGVFLVLAAAVLTDSVLFVLPLMALLWFLWRATACLYGLHTPGGDLPLPAAKNELSGLVIMIAGSASLFFIMPRFDAHALLQPTQPRMQTSGFSDRVQLGDFAHTLDATVVMRIEPLEALATPTDRARFQHQIGNRYWRGTTLNHFNGSGWQRGNDKIIRSWGKGTTIQTSRQAGNQRFGIALYREATDHPFLPLPEGFSSLIELPAAMSLLADGALRFVAAPPRRLRLQMVLGQRTPLPTVLAQPTAQDRDTRRIPSALRTWLATIAPDQPIASQRLLAVQRQLVSWQYDLHVHLDDRHPIAAFINKKRGHCELYATTLALAARQLGIPAHVVNGYFGGEWNGVGGFVLIRQQHAHSWVEVWLHGRWQRLDPTPPSRWGMSDILLPQLDAVWESVKFAWYRYVLAFRDSDRTATLRALWRLLTALVQHQGAWLFSILLVVAGGWWLWRLRQQPRRTRATSSMPQIDRWLVRHGIQRPISQPLSQLPLPDGIDPRQWLAFVTAWEQRIYGSVQPWPRWKVALRLWQLNLKCNYSAPLENIP
ncbi:MAG: DUF3488 and transglutaminase-like domain-containing protein [Mariprofundales bacterium]